MGTVRCEGCEKRLDTHRDDVECEETKYGDRWYCIPCAEKMLEKSEALERKAAIFQQQQEGIL